MYDADGFTCYAGMTRQVDKVYRSIELTTAK